MKKKILLMFVMLVIAFSFGTSIETEAKTTKMITVKTADKDTAEKLDTQLRKGQKFIVKVKGSKSKSNALLAKTNKKLKKVNKYSVKMNSKRGKTKKGYTYYTVSADNAKLYKYTIALLADMYHSKLLEKR